MLWLERVGGKPVASAAHKLAADALHLDGVAVAEPLADQLAKVLAEDGHQAERLGVAGVVELAVVVVLLLDVADVVLVHVELVQVQQPAEAPQLALLILALELLHEGAVLQRHQVLEHCLQRAVVGQTVQNQEGNVDQAVVVG